MSNCEAPAAIGGGAEAIRFDSDGAISDAYRILGGTNVNCSGGGTPWGTWLSCEEVDKGRVWECDPKGKKPAVARPAMGVFKHEAAAVDPRGKRVYLTEDLGDGGFYRFTPKRWPDLSKGRLEIASVATNGGVRWHPVPDPSATTTPTRQQVPGSTPFARGEGIWFDDGTVYVATTADNRVHAYDTRRRRIEVIYDAAKLTDPPLTGVDNITVARSGDLYVCEDNGRARPRHRADHARPADRPLPDGHRSRHPHSELTGVVFDPRGRRLYFSSQRFDGTGAIFEVTGPFRTGRPAQAVRPPAYTRRVDEFGVFVVFAFVVWGGILYALGRWYPGSGAEQVDWKPTRSPELEAELELDDVDQMIEAQNARRRATRAARDHRGRRSRQGGRGPALARRAPPALRLRRLNGTAGAGPRADRGLRLWRAVRSARRSCGTRLGRARHHAARRGHGSRSRRRGRRPLWRIRTRWPRSCRSSRECRSSAGCWGAPRALPWPASTAQRLQSLLEHIVDTPVRGLVYQGGGSVPDDLLARRQASSWGGR